MRNLVLNSLIACLSLTLPNCSSKTTIVKPEKPIPQHTDWIEQPGPEIEKVNSFTKVDAQSIFLLNRQLRKDSLIAAIQEEGILVRKQPGCNGVGTEQWKRFTRFSNELSSNELITLTDHKSPVVRCYAFQALVDRKDPDVFPILINHLVDTQKVETFSGCKLNIEVTGDYFLDVVTLGQINTTQRNTLDSILLFNPTIKLNAKYSLLSEIQPIDMYYLRIKQIAQKEINTSALLALSRYQKKSDLNIFKKALKQKYVEYYPIYAAREFPDKTLFPLLVNIFEREWKEKYYDCPKWRILYQALAKYPRNKTFQLFKRTVSVTDSFRYQTLCTYLAIALDKYPNPLFDPLQKRIKLDKDHLKYFYDQRDSDP